MNAADRARILAEARDILQRADAAIRTKPYQPPSGLPPPESDDELGSWPRDGQIFSSEGFATDASCTRVPLVSAKPLERCASDAIVRKAAEDAAREQRKVDEWLHRSAEQQQQVYVDQSPSDDLVELARRLADLFETVGDLIDANAEHRDRISKLEAQIDNLRAEHQHERELGYWTEHFARATPKKSKVIDLPAIPLRRVS